MKKTILLIDDSDFILETNKELLEAAGYNIITANNGLQGIEVAIKELPDMIICNVSMPGLSGFEVVEQIKNNKRTSLTPFMFLTGFTDKSKMREGREKGADDYLTKPYTKKELIGAVDALWRMYERKNINPNPRK
ncbi:MAG: response regulator [Bacteroidetes bacterium]|nr:response regulator [Bacteroidota bacterium]